MSEEVLMKLDQKEQHKAEHKEKNDIYYEYYYLMIIIYK